MRHAIILRWTPSPPPICRAIVAGLAFALAFVFGAVANRVNFCTMGAISDIVNFGDWKRMRMWVLAIAVAIAGQRGAGPARADRPVQVAVHRRQGRLAVGHRRRLPVRLRHDAGVRLRQQDADPRRRRQPEVAGGAGGVRRGGVDDAARAVRRLAHGGTRSLAHRLHVDRADLRPAGAARRARARRDGQGLAAVRRRGRAC